MRLILRVYENEEEESVPRVFKITQGPVMIGRASYNSIVIDDPRISNEHARVIYKDGHWLIEDLGSANGLLEEGNRKAEIVLSSGLEFWIGPIRIESHVDAIGTPGEDQTQEIDLGFKRKSRLPSIAWKTHLGVSMVLALLSLLSYVMGATRLEFVSECVIPFLVLLGVVYGGAGVFSIFSKLHAKRYWFARFLIPSTFIVAGLSLVSLFEDFVLFNLGSLDWGVLFGSVVKIAVIWSGVYYAFKTLLQDVPAQKVLVGVSVFVVMGFATLGTVRHFLEVESDGYENYGPLSYPMIPLSWRNTPSAAWGTSLDKMAASLEEQRVQMISEGDFAVTSEEDELDDGEGEDTEGDEGGE